MKRLLVYFLLGILIFLFLGFVLPTKQINLVRPKLEYIEGSKEYTILFVGDIMLSRAVGGKIEKYNDPTFPFQKVYKELASADLTFGNLESPISKRGEKMGSIYSFRADPKVIQGLTLSGFDVLSLANNHIFDYGALALLDTVNILKEKGISPVGAGKNEIKANEPAIFDLGDTTVGFLAYTNLYPKSLEAKGDFPGISSIGRASEFVKDLSEYVDIVVVSMHAGEEYSREANEYQKNLAKELINNGANIIIGHHPHVTQEIEKYEHGWIAYSLGNFVFDQSFSKETQEGFMIRAVVKDKKIKEFIPLLVNISKDFQAEMTLSR